MRKDFKKDIDSHAVTIIAIKSEMGATHKIVSTARKMAGRIKINGVKQTTSRTTQKRTLKGASAYL